VRPCASTRSTSERSRCSIVNLAPINGLWSVLDVGCGSGRYALALAAAGASRVLGVDISDEMIRIAGHEAGRQGHARSCEFRTGGFLELPIGERFDAVVATGYFDYLEDPGAHLRKMLELCSGRIFASFPKRWEFRVPVRRLRFALRGGFVRFYSKREVLRLFAGAGVAPDRLSLIDLGRDWVAVARP
jgi:2-polyprenyl-3-methyl-5-hydroxy-6-metoxy-1,4-benzoquinol methylase